MTNEERRHELNEARSKAVHYAKLAEEKYVENAKAFSQVMCLGDMWANVAQALKTGGHDADSTDH